MSRSTEDLMKGNGLGLHKIRCADCKEERETRHKNTKYCVVCRLNRNLKFIGTSTKECPACKKRFAPLHRNELMCGECDPKIAVGEPRDVCGFCGEEKDIILDRVKVCHACATDPKNRDQFRVSLAMKVKQTKERNDG